MHGPTLAPKSPGLGGLPRQHLSFLLANEEDCLDLRVQGFSSATPLPNTPPHIRRVVSLDGGHG